MNKTWRINSLTPKHRGSALCALLLVLCMLPSRISAYDSDADEIKLLISRAPLARAVQESKGEELLVVLRWLSALVYSGRVEDAYASEPRVRKRLSHSDLLAAIAVGLSLAGKPDEALLVAHKIKRDPPNYTSQGIA